VNSGRPRATRSDCSSATTPATCDAAAEVPLKVPQKVKSRSMVAKLVISLGPTRSGLTGPDWLPVGPFELTSEMVSKSGSTVPPTERLSSTTARSDRLLTSFVYVSSPTAIVQLRRKFGRSVPERRLTARK